MTAHEERMRFRGSSEVEDKEQGVAPWMNPCKGRAYFRVYYVMLIKIKRKLRSISRGENWRRSK